MTNATICARNTMTENFYLKTLSLGLLHTLSLYGYCMPSQLGEVFLSAELTGKVDALLRRLTKFRYLTDKLTVADSDTDLFKKMQMPQHCLHHLLPPLRTTDSLRQRGHPFSLPECYTNIQ